MSAGLIPFCVRSNEILFLFQKTFSGRKMGYLIDFGGGSNPGEKPQQTAAREFVEETETLFFENDLSKAHRTEDRVKQQATAVLDKLKATLHGQPNWWSSRRQKPGKPSKDWCTFFMEVSYQPVEPLNKAWQTDTSGRFKKRRELHWITAEQLLYFYQQEPERLWKRVRELERGQAIVKDIVATLKGASPI